jgi:hypothetical protein
MVRIDTVYHFEDEQLLISPVIDGTGNVAVLVRFGDEHVYSWPSRVALLHGSGKLETFCLGGETRSIYWTTQGQIILSKSEGLFVWTPGDKQDRCIGQGFPGGRLVPMRDDCFLLVVGLSPTSLLITYRDDSANAEPLSFINTTRMPWHEPMACLYGQRPCLSLEHGLLAFPDGTEWRVPGTTKGRVCAGLWNYHGKICSLSEWHSGEQELAVWSPLGKRKAQTFNLEGQRLIAKYPSEALRAFLHTQDRPEILRVVSMESGALHEEVDCGIGFITGFAEGAGVLMAFGSRGIARLQETQGT